MIRNSTLFNINNLIYRNVNNIDQFLRERKKYICLRQHKSIWNDFANMSRFILIYGRSKENKDLMQPSLENKTRKNWT